MPAPDVSICIVTFRRPASLARLLESIAALSGLEGIATETIVVDNDAAESARCVTSAMRDRIPNLGYFVEPRQNIALARNEAVRHARGRWIAFVDDDEAVSPRWVAAYLCAAAEGDADAYFGPVWARPEAEPPAWLDPRLFLDLKASPDGAPVDPAWTRTTNAFVKRELLERHGFDPSYGRTGGSDFELFLRGAEAGARYLFCAEAETCEFFPAARLRLGWLLQRSFRTGWVAARVDRVRRPGRKASAERALRGFFRALRFGAKTPLTALRSRTRAVVRLRSAARWLGYAWEAAGRTYHEYPGAEGTPVSR